MRIKNLNFSNQFSFAKSDLAKLVTVLFFLVLFFAVAPTAAHAADRYWVGNGGNWHADAATHWASSSNGAPGAGEPTSSDNCYFDLHSFTSGSQTVTVDATANCLSMDWTGAGTYTPTLAGSVAALYVNGNFTTISAMNWTFNYALVFTGAGTHNITTNGLNIFVEVDMSGGTVNFLDNFRCAYVYLKGGTLNSNNFTIQALEFNIIGSTAKTLTLGYSPVNIGKWNYAGSNLTLTANTATINVTGTGAFTGGGLTYYNVNLNGTAHTISGNNTFTTLTRNGMATKTDTLTLTSGSTQTVTTFAMIGNSATNRLLVQSSTLGSPATITATSWLGTANVDFMDITSTNSIDMSAAGGGTGDCGGNSVNMTFTTGVTQNFTNVAGGSWSTAGNWTSRVPLPQDDVTITTAFNSGVTITVDMPRIGKSIDFSGMSWSGTATTVSIPSTFSVFGSLTMKSGATNSIGNYIYFYGRSSYILTSAGTTFVGAYIDVVGGTLTLQDDASFSSGFYHNNGTLNTNNKNLSVNNFHSNTTATRTLNLGSSVITIVRSTGSMTTWDLTSTGLTFNVGTSAIVFSSTGTSIYTFYGAGLTYNNVVVQGTGNYTLTITGDNTFNTFTVDRSQAAKTIIFTPGSTQTFTNFYSQTAGTTLLTLNTGGATASVASAGNVMQLDYLDITDVTASAPSKWYYGNNSAVHGTTTNWATSDIYRYWVGHSANWNTTASWSTVSGGASGASIPASTNNCRFDANSFNGAGQTVTVDATANCLSMDWTGATNTPTLAHGSSFNFDTYGSVTFIANMIHTGTARLKFAGNTNVTFTAGGVLSFALEFYLQGTSVTFQDDVNNGSQQLRLLRGIIITNNKTITCGQVLMEGVEGTTVTLGSSIINATSWSYTGSRYTLTANTSTINCSGNFTGGGINYNGATLNLTGATSTISGNNTFAQLNLASGTTQTISFTDGSIQTVTSANLSGSVGHIHTLKGTGAAGWQITKAGGGTITANYLSLSYSTGSPAKTWYAKYSTDGGNNIGWIFLNATVQASNLQKGLVGWWKFNGNAKDNTPYANNGTVTGATLTADRKGQANKAYSFDGSSNYIDAGNNSVLNIVNDISIEVWEKRNVIGTWQALVDRRDIGSGNSINYLLVWTNDNKILFNYREIGTQANQIWATTDSFTDTAWHNIVLTYTFGVGTSIKVYVDGQLKAGSWAGSNGNAVPVNVSNSYLNVGKTVNNYYYFNGSIDDVHIYNRVLSATEITDLYEEYDPGIVVSDLQKGLVARWKMDGNAKDATPYSNNGTVTGATLTTDRKGQANKAYSFSGSNYMITPSLMNYDTVTVAAWVNTGSNDTGEREIICNFESAGYGLFQTSNKLGFQADISGYKAVLADNSPTIGTWYYVVGTYDNSTIKLYINGVLQTAQTSVSGPIVDSTMAMTIGANPSGTPPGTTFGSDWIGSLDDVRIYNRALSPTEITALYESY